MKKLVCGNVLRYCVMLIATVLQACASPPDRADVRLLRMVREADASYMHGNLTTAKMRYRALLERNPKYAPAHLRLGAIAYRENDAHAAKAHFEQALAFDPSSSQAAYNLAMLSLNDASRLLRDFAARAPDAPARRRVMLLLGDIDRFAADTSP